MADELDAAVLAFNTEVLTPLRLALRRAFPGALVDIEFFKDVLIDSVIMDIRFKLYGQETGRHEKTEYIRVPATWFDAWLVETRLGRLVGRWRKAKYTTHKLTVVVVTNVAFPEWVHSHPELGGPVKIAVMNSTLFKDM